MNRYQNRIYVCSIVFCTIAGANYGAYIERKNPLVGCVYGSFLGACGGVLLPILVPIAVLSIPGILMAHNEQQASERAKQLL